jgi:mRNA interferase YafQ
MKALNRTTRFRRDLRKENRRDPGVQDILKPVISDLLMGKALPQKMNDHPLSGDWKDHRDCHVKPDLVLIYKTDDDAVTLVRLGSHSELF